MINIDKDFFRTIPARDQFGLWCTHGKRLLMSGPDDWTLRAADPWPCDKPECSLETVNRELAEEAADADQTQWDEYNAIVREGLSM